MNLEKTDVWVWAVEISQRLIVEKTVGETSPAVHGKRLVLVKGEAS
jgi:hypothetical protein